jgi:F0F1-type ATP synthase gamma subunit
MKSVIELLFIYDANYIGNENGFCSKAKAQDAITAMRLMPKKLGYYKIFLLPLKVMQEENIPHNVILKVLVVVTSNRGLAGAFNTIIKEAKNRAEFMQENK